MGLKLAGCITPHSGKEPSQAGRWVRMASAAGGIIHGGAERRRLGAPVNQWSQQKPVLHKTRQRACACASGRDEVRGLGRRRAHCTGCTARADMCRRRGEWAGTVVPRLAKLY